MSMQVPSQTIHRDKEKYSLHGYGDTYERIKDREALLISEGWKVVIHKLGTTYYTYIRR